MTLCFDIGGTRIKYAKIDNQYNIEQVNVIPTPKNFNDFKRKIIKILDASNEKNVGFSVAGIVDYKSKTVKHSPNMLFLNNFSFNEFNIQSTHIEVENDANAACLNSYRIYKVPNMIHLTLGTGLGGGAIVNGKLLKSSVSVFEVGHISASINGKRCGCNNRGCIEKYTGIEHIIEFAKKNNVFDTLEHIFGNYSKNKIYKRIVDRFAQYLGIVVADLINVFGSDLIVFSGGIANNFDAFSQTLKKTVHRRSFVYRIKPCAFAVEENPTFAGLLGIASIFNEGLYG
ncbi:putative ROK-family transcriptional regulator [Desulfurella amilsii]|uniref:Putative ROK-family transcriptional regulator n=1 Tax=Desulfurella amilsii TaxID=1562698 RepID=A0A1X4XXN0_9BACT|nr:ROK family protein [Desulfurella amilsii]OSS42292.1 putative ROK-family transcriptional regulator [Desulfurella amilsii]